MAELCIDVQASVVVRRCFLVCRAGKKEVLEPRGTRRGTEKSTCYFFSAFRISRAAFAPEPPVNPVPGCVPLPHKKSRSIGVL